MNQFVPDWNTMRDASALSCEDDELVELLWCNGHVVMQSQAHRKPSRPEKAAAAGVAMQEDEADAAAAWFPYTLDDSLEKDLFSELFGEMPDMAVAGGVEKCGGAGPVAESKSKLMPPPKPMQATGSSQQTVSLADGSKSGGLPDLVMPRMVTEAGESSLLTIGSSICESNQVQTRHPAGLSDTVRSDVLPKNAGAHEGTVTSSSRPSGSSLAGTDLPSTSDWSGKRKQRDATESESPSEDAESESAAAHRPAQKLATSRRRRAAEVHNLSERRRRDRINEKMKALQELIPHCNKTDKASMLDEAIEYLKSLQLQVQMMWMGGGLAPPVMLPGIHQYIPRMGVGMSPHMASMPRMPFMAPPAVPNSPVNLIPMHAPGSDSSTHPYARFLGAGHLQPPSLGLSFYPLGAKTAQQNPGDGLPATSPATMSVENTPNKRSSARSIEPDRVAVDN